ncbi:MAG TPA: VOC family protein [Polyangiaceae bacterium]|nr:VOC family protein [Polyangiaceae bacterium]
MGPNVKHLHLACRDPVSQRFYEKYFGFRFDALFPRGDEPAATILRSPFGFQIYLEGPSSERLPAWFHFGFLVESAAACSDLYDRMRQDGVAIARPLVAAPFTNYFFEDPDGHLVQVYFDPLAL